jgi:hypothetical protein
MFASMVNGCLLGFWFGGLGGDWAFLFLLLGVWVFVLRLTKRSPEPWEGSVVVADGRVGTVCDTLFLIPFPNLYLMVCILHLLQRKECLSFVMVISITNRR